MKPTTILVPLDGSALAEAALPYAIDLLGDRPGTTLVLIRAVDPRLPGVDDPGAQRGLVQAAEEYLAEVARRLTGFGGTVKTAVWYGPPATSIVEAARAENADMIVVSTHGRSGLGRVILGSVTERVLRSTRLPILVVRDSAAPIDAPRSSEASLASGTGARA